MGAHVRNSQTHQTSVSLSVHYGALSLTTYICSYESHLVDTLYQFAPNPREPLSELEVFTGTILGKSGGMPNGRVQQYNMDMKAKADRDVQYIIE